MTEVTATRHVPQQPQSGAAIQKAAQDFTGVALNEMLSPMFESADQSNPIFGGGAGEQAWRPMLTEEIAKSIARSGGFGLTAAVAAAMLHMQESGR